MPRGDRRYGTGAWRKVRAHVLDRDARVCQIAAPGCTGVATQVDHIIPALDGGPFYEPANLRAACAGCNSRRARRGSDRGEAWRSASTRIVLIVGPPGADLSTVARDRAAPGDLIVDYEALSEAVGVGQAAHEAVMAARGSLLGKLRAGTLTVARAWIVSANPDAERRFPHHELVVVDPGADVVRRNARRDGQPDSFMRLIDSWYASREPAPVGPSREW